MPWWCARINNHAGCHSTPLTLLRSSGRQARGIVLVPKLRLGTHPPAVDSASRFASACGGLDVPPWRSGASLSKGRSLGPRENRSPNGSDSHRLFGPYITVSRFRDTGGPIGRVGQGRFGRRPTIPGPPTALMVGWRSWSHPTSHIGHGDLDRPRKLAQRPVCQVHNSVAGSP